MDHQHFAAVRRLMKLGYVACWVHVCQLRVLVEDRNDGLFAAGMICLHEFAHGFAWSLVAACSTFFASVGNSLDDLSVAALVSDDDWAGGVALGPDAGVGVGAKFEQDLAHFQIATKDGHVHGTHLAAAEVNDLGTTSQEFAGGGEIAAFDRFVQFVCGNPVDGGLQLGPAFEAVRAREDELGVV